MKTSHTKVSVGKLCMLFGKTRHAYYDRLWHFEKEKMNAVVLEMVSEIRQEIPRIGTRKLHYMLQPYFNAYGIKIGRDTLHKLLQDNNLIVRQNKRFAVTTNSKHWMKKYPNLIKNLDINRPEQVWVSDITYILVEDGFNFLNLITDNYSKRVMGYCLHPNLEAEGTLTALHMALSNRQYHDSNLIHHSDRGAQYCSHAYVKLLQNNRIGVSMTENGDPYENPVAERVNGILKQDFDLQRRFTSRKKAVETTHRSILAYNKLRPHMSCDLLTPEVAHKMTGTLKKKWKKKVYLKNV